MTYSKTSINWTSSLRYMYQALTHGSST